MRRVKVCLALVALIVLGVLAISSLVGACQKARCRSGEDPKYEREFEEGLRINCDERIK